jgi:hypothetical protein
MIQTAKLTPLHVCYLCATHQSLDHECTEVDYDNQLPLINAGVNVGDVSMGVDTCIKTSKKVSVLKPGTMQHSCETNQSSHEDVSVLTLPLLFFDTSVRAVCSSTPLLPLRTKHDSTMPSLMTLVFCA